MTFLAIVGLFALLALGCWLFAACIKLHAWLWKLRNDLDNLDDTYRFHLKVSHYQGGSRGQQV